METLAKSTTTSPVPVPETMRRIAGYDIARSFALLGMVVVHFSLVLASDRSGPGWLVSILGFLDGRAAATFVILAGVGLTLRSQPLDRLRFFRHVVGPIGSARHRGE
jgi:uncharacterized membrane protein